MTDETVSLVGLQQAVELHTQPHFMPPWQDLTLNGCSYSLAHLQPFTTQVTPKGLNAPTFKMYVSFGPHAFSTKWDDSQPEHYKMHFGQDVRCFCPIRHRHSLNLPSIVQAAVSGRAYFSQNRNYLLIDKLPGLIGPYAVFFNIEKAKSKDFHAAMFVVSAYEKPELSKSLPTITFATLVAKTARGEKIVRPKK